MALRKKSIPQDVQKVQKRIDGMKSIDPDLDLGDGISVATMVAAVKEVTDSVGRYNVIMSSGDDEDNTYRAKKKDMNSLSTRVLLAVKLKYGEDSTEYEMVGGTRSSERKKRTTKTEPQT